MVLAATLALSCDRPADQAAATGATTTASVAPVDSGAAKPACPATGLWSRCALVERLERSGLVPIVDSTPVTEPPLAAEGILVRVGRGELEVYLYPDASARERDAAKLDRTRYVEYNAPVTMEQQATLIMAGNAIAVLHSRNDQLRERVGDAITAGAPAKAP